jgi:polysaccharide export outer membrane protein
LVKDAAVTVSVTEVNSYRFTVAGNVESPGLFTARYYLTVSEALALAGGPNRYADTDEVVVVRTINGTTLRIPINYDDILSGKSPEQDIVILAGDSVRVP